LKGGENLNCDRIIEKRKKIWDKNHDIEKDTDYRNQIARLVGKKHDPKSQKIREEIQQKPYKLIEMFFVIANKEGKTVPFFINTVQK
jgi:hypothetical protein